MIKRLGHVGFFGYFVTVLGFGFLTNPPHPTKWKLSTAGNVKAPVVFRFTFPIIIVAKVGFAGYFETCPQTKTVYRSCIFSLFYILVLLVLLAWDTRLMTLKQSNKTGWLKWKIIFLFNFIKKLTFTRQTQDTFLYSHEWTSSHLM